MTVRYSRLSDRFFAKPEARLLNPRLSPPLVTDHCPLATAAKLPITQLPVTSSNGLPSYHLPSYQLLLTHDYLDISMR